MAARTRWRCGDLSCPQHRWQVVKPASGEDPLRVAEEQLWRHWRDKHEVVDDTYAGENHENNTSKKGENR